SQKQNRIIPVQDIVKSFYKNNLRENEIIEEIIIPKPEKDDFLFFDKVGSRKTVSIARLNIGAKLKVENDLIKEAVVCFGALSEKAFRAKNVENYLKGRKINNISTKTYNEKLKNVVDEAIPGRYSQQYKRNAICGLGDNLLNNLRIYAEKGE
ncbi:MAG: FAD binding domain-containing protein, partial [Bacillota bacterium]